MASVLSPQVHRYTALWSLFSKGMHTTKSSVLSLCALQTTITLLLSTQELDLWLRAWVRWKHTQKYTQKLPQFGHITWSWPLLGLGHKETAYNFLGSVALSRNDVSKVSYRSLVELALFNPSS